MSEPSSKPTDSKVDSTRSARVNKAQSLIHEGLQSLRSQLKCGVCQCLLRVPPSRLQCGHSFCQECLTSWMNSDGPSSSSSSINSSLSKCPVCRETFKRREICKRDGTLGALTGLFTRMQSEVADSLGLNPLTQNDDELGQPMSQIPSQWRFSQMHRRTLAVPSQPALAEHLDGQQSSPDMEIVRVKESENRTIDIENEGISSDDNDNEDRRTQSSHREISVSVTRRISRRVRSRVNQAHRQESSSQRSRKRRMSGRSTQMLAEEDKPSLVIQDTQSDSEPDPSGCHSSLNPKNKRQSNTICPPLRSRSSRINRGKQRLYQRRNAFKLDVLDKNPLSLDLAELPVYPVRLGKIPEMRGFLKKEGFTLDLTIDKEGKIEEESKYFDENSDPSVCHVCFALIQDEMVRCDACRMSVHVQCFGVPRNVNEMDHWYCDVCEIVSKAVIEQFEHKVDGKEEMDSLIRLYCKHYKRNLQCCMCQTSNVDWALKKAVRTKDSPKDYQKKMEERIVQELRNEKKSQSVILRQMKRRKNSAINNEGLIFAHVSCAQYLNEPQIGDPLTMSPLYCADGMHDQRSKLVCLFCQNTGACIQCDHPRCVASFHVPCGHRSECLLMEYEKDGTEGVLRKKLCPFHNDAKQVTRNHCDSSDSGSSSSDPNSDCESESEPSPRISRMRHRYRTARIKSQSSGRLRSTKRNLTKMKQTEREEKNDSGVSTMSSVIRKKRRKNHGESSESQSGSMVILYSKLIEQQIQQLKDFKASFDSRTEITLTKVWSDSVTHLVSGTELTGDDHAIMPKRTEKYFQAILSGKWVLCFDWINECLKKGRLIPEKRFEVIGDGTCGETGGPRKARLSKMNESAGLFSGFTGIVIPSYHGAQGLGSSDNRELIERLMRLGGVSGVMDRMRDGPRHGQQRKLLVVIDERQQLSSRSSQTLNEWDKVTRLTMKGFFDCISRFEVPTEMSL